MKKPKIKATVSVKLQCEMLLTSYAGCVFQWNEVNGVATVVYAVLAGGQPNPLQVLQAPADQIVDALQYQLDQMTLPKELRPK